MPRKSASIQLQHSLDITRVLAKCCGGNFYGSSFHKKCHFNSKAVMVVNCLLFSKCSAGLWQFSLIYYHSKTAWNKLLLTYIKLRTAIFHMYLVKLRLSLPKCFIHYGENTQQLFAMIYAILAVFSNYVFSALSSESIVSKNICYIYQPKI